MSSCLSYYNQSDVVMLRMAAGEIADIGNEAVDHSLCALARAGAEGTGHPFRAKFIAIGIERFRYAVGVKQQAIVALEGHGKIAGYPIEHVSTVNSEGHSRRLQDLDFAGRGAIEERGVVPAARE